MTTPSRIRFIGARRGQGTTTIAVAVAARAVAAGHRVAVVVADLDDACAACAVATPNDTRPVQVLDRLTIVPVGCEADDDADLVIEDISEVEAEIGTAIVVLVIRGPDYLGLRTALTHAIGAHGAVVIREPWRALTPADVSSVLGLPVIAEVPHSDEVARANDAGLLVCRAASMRPFNSLQSLVSDALPPVLDTLPVA